MISFILPFAALVLSDFASASPAPKKIATAIPIRQRSETSSGAARRFRARNAGIPFSASQSSQNLKRAVAINPFDIQDLRRTLDTRGTVTGVAPLLDIEESLWNGPVSIGTPAQQFSCHFDTGSSDLIVPTIACKNCSDHLFSGSASTTFVSTTIPFGTGFGDNSSANGTIGYDTVTIAGIAVEQQAFGALSASDKIPEDSCVFGLGFQAAAQTNTTTWFDKVVASGQLASNVFSYYLKRNSTNASEMCFGCVDSTKYTGAVEYYPINTNATGGVDLLWVVDSAGFSISGKNATVPLVIIMDTGSTDIFVPNVLAEIIFAQFSSFTNLTEAGNTFYTAPCSDFETLPPIGILFGETNYVIDPRDFNKGPIDDDHPETCAAAITGQDTNEVLVGDAFFKSWYTVFDYENKQVGFAPIVEA